MHAWAAKWRFEASDSSGKILVNGVSDFKAYGEITEFDPPHVLAYTWLGNWHDSSRAAIHGALGTLGHQDRYRATVARSGLADQPIARKDYVGGWPGLLELLRKYCE